ncbi:nucleoside triphosphatase YtkD [Salinicoccus jeotgali]|uniref:Nucleoside triphosphatase YtkD n=1 Tax=Salinicoccus jeotgali TaxID=381634 RepID=A0ABP7ES30_9STAP
MLEFTDHHERKVTFDPNSAEDADHVLGICKMDGKYLFTEHKVRGIEFPGGKLEDGETLREALQREVFEETGASLAELKYMGAYTVHGTQPFKKGVYFGIVDDLFFKCEYMETYGPVVYPSIEAVPEEKRSFLLDDPCIHYIYEISRTDGFFS